MKNVGFIGLGIMGKPMAKNLLRKGYRLTVYNRSRPPIVELEGLGARGVNSSKEVAESSDVVITMLPDSHDVEQVVLGSNGVSSGIKTGSILIDMSTISPITTKKIAGQLASLGVDMLDAPVSGGEKGAIEATLSIMVGGKKDVFEKCMEIFQALGRNIVHVGDVGMGQVVKACNQIVVALTLEAVGEALVLGYKAGVDPELIIKALGAGAARCWALEARGPNILDRNFRPGFKVRLHHKDLGIALATGKEFGVPLPVTSLVHEMFGALEVAGRGELDHSSVITLLEDLAKTEVRKRVSA
jgi:2-hydroxy-3-oxopropionate reductase